MNYPTSPYLGQLHIQDGNLWRWNGLTWGVISLKIANSPSPSTSTSGDLTLEALEARITEIEEALNQSFLLIE
jgi:hypothetical protein